MLLSTLLALAVMNSDLRSFVSRPQPDFKWERVSSTEFRLTSQNWMGGDWHHQIHLEEPREKPLIKDTAYLVVTGDRVDSVDVPFAKHLARECGLPVFTLFNVPNQPLYDLREDDLIAHTFGAFLDSGNKDWPLLLPMVNSVSKAMDGIQKESHGKIRRFIVTGESKRGWTTWLTAALGDKRVIGIAPVAFDNLNFAAQLQHQMRSWGHLSEMLGSYSGPGLTEEAGSAKGQELIHLVDPYAYLDSIEVPVLVVRGSNDPYWTADATNLYWDQIKAPKYLRVLPNEGHDFQKDEDYIKSLAWFVGVCLDSGYRPKIDVAEKGDEISADWDGRAKSIRFWVASSETKDFRHSRWEMILERPAGHAVATKLSFAPVKGAPSTKGYIAYFIEAVLEDGASVTSPIQILSAK